VWWRVREAGDAADFVITEWEHRLDRRIGERNRRTLARYGSLLIIAVPVAWIGAGFHFNSTALAGSLAGISLYAIIDLARTFVTRSRRP
jgi:hypothetical protein